MNEALAGAVAGVFAGIIGQPFDTIKTMQQTSTKINYRHLYKGFVAQTNVQICCNSLLFGVYGYSKDNIFKTDNPVCYKSAFLTGLIEGFVYTPLEVIKTQKQLGIPIKLNCSLQSLYPCMLRESIGNCIYFTSYFYAKDKLLELDYSSNISILTAGGISGVCYWALIFPLDTIKSRMFANKKQSFKGIYRGLGISLLRAVPVNCATFYGYELAYSWLR